ncbi:MAG: hypothetical protein U0175_27245 [Caldilineaceae bacterium]
MSFSATVDSRYRLIAADLGGRARSVIVTRISYQGVENLQPMLHFEGVGKPLALDPSQRLVVSQIARSTAVSDWVGLMMELHPIEHEGRSWIEITPVGGRRQRVRASTPPPAPARSAPPKPVPVEPRMPRREAKVQETEMPAQTQPAVRWFSYNDIPQTSVWTPILVAILVILAFAAVYQLETNDAAWQWLYAWIQ